MKIMVSALQYQNGSIAVAGGELHYGLWGERGPIILASHGLTAHHMSFASLANSLGAGFRVLAPDHRGRGHSRDIRGPWGMKAHAEDLLSLLDALNIEAVDLLLGHSMGGFIAAVTAAMAPTRVPHILMVDGGLPLMQEPPPGISIEALIQSIVGPSMDRLDMRFESREDYHALWRQHPAFAHCWGADTQRYVDYDLVGTAPELMSSAVKSAIIADVETQLIGETVPEALRALRQPIRFLTAPRGMVDDAPLYRPDIFQLWEPQLHDFSRRELLDVNHFTILLIEQGARQVADEIRQCLQA
ncbi:MAG: alpha/beta fold hydrolase [Oceanococcus sp.]